jgi:hypothetical protein
MQHSRQLATNWRCTARPSAWQAQRDRAFAAYATKRTSAALGSALSTTKPKPKLKQLSLRKRVFLGERFPHRRASTRRPK